MTKTTAGNLDWINNLRLLALFAVIILHTTSPVLEQYNREPIYTWLVGDLYNSLSRFAVPVFVMITGALLLHREYDLSDFLKKRLLRVGIPFLFWSMVYIAWSYYNEELVYTGDFWLTLKQVLHQLKYGSQYHLWYVYMLLGLYFIIPVLSKFIRNATEKEVLYFLTIWLVVMLISQPYLTRYDPKIDLHYFAGYIGYLVLGHYLAFKPFTVKRGALWAGLATVISLAVITVGTYLLYRHYNGISTLLYEPLSPAIVILSASIFLLFRFMEFNLSPRLKQIRDFAGQYNYGIYLAHALVLTLLDAFDYNFKLFNALFSIPLVALACFLFTLPLVFIISKIPLGKYVAG